MVWIILVIVEGKTHITSELLFEGDVWVPGNFNKGLFTYRIDNPPEP